MMKFDPFDRPELLAEDLHEFDWYTPPRPRESPWWWLALLLAVSALVVAVTWLP